MESNEFLPGETIHCWEPGEKYMAHRFMLYLGKDKNAPDNILVQSKQRGWDIISLSEMPKTSCRSMGRYNLIETLTEKNKPFSFTYRFHDGSQAIHITVKLIKGIWSIKKGFKNPSWLIKEGG